ncbi:MAG TPA: histidine kinase [Flavitalea sp.]|nr:histidine kinase [Flavitalea sp.]
MNPWKPTRIEWITYFALVPVIDLMLNFLLFGKRMWDDESIWLISMPLITVIVFISWYLHIVAMHWFRHRFPLLSQTVKRASLVSLTHVFMTSGTFALIFLGYDFFQLLDYTLDVQQYKFSILVAIGITLLATTLWEAEYVWSKWKESLAEKQQLEQLSIQQEFDTLKSQVNPHFLFNCFNTLSSLITEDPIQAEVFLNELSKVYRYLLRSNENGLSTLQNELRFIQSYYNLLRTRYGDAIQIQIETDPSYDQYLLPSLTLQLLVENAVKHNVVSRQNPLMVDIFTMAGNKLAVNNNLQSKQVKPLSNKIGLDNIRSKYELLHEEGFQVLEDDRNFTVVLPLIWYNAGEKRIMQLQHAKDARAEEF